MSIIYFAGPLAIIAGAGSGKTTTVSARLAYGCLAGELDPERSLALTFTTRAAGQLRSRLRSLNAPMVATRTIHSAALRQLRYFWPMLDGTRPPHVLADATALVRDAAESLGVRLPPRAARELLTDFAWAKSNFIDESRFADEYAVRRSQAGNAHTAARIYAEYELLKRKTFAMDFDDVLLFLLALLDEHSDALVMVRRQYQHITVDEFQDLTPLQFRVLKEWVGPRGSICAVGDPAQAIYGFAGATSAYLRRFEHEFGRAHVV
ncbi:MAG: ATP-dependent helicase, partial [Actinobacteria bacterium]|nr:ATP-dependent helicase [Actinomycetota bacterium]